MGQLLMFICRRVSSIYINIYANMILARLIFRYDLQSKIDQFTPTRHRQWDSSVIKRDITSETIVLYHALNFLISESTFSISWRYLCCFGWNTCVFEFPIMYVYMILRRWYTTNHTTTQICMEDIWILRIFATHCMMNSFSETQKYIHMFNHIPTIKSHTWLERAHLYCISNTMVLLLSQTNQQHITFSL